MPSDVAGCCPNVSALSNIFGDLIPRILAKNKTKAFLFFTFGTSESIHSNAVDLTNGEMISGDTATAMSSVLVTHPKIGIAYASVTRESKEVEGPATVATMEFLQFGDATRQTRLRVEGGLPDPTQLAVGGGAAGAGGAAGGGP